MNFIFSSFPCIILFLWDPCSAIPKLRKIYIRFLKNRYMLESSFKALFESPLSGEKEICFFQFCGIPVVQ
jgi:hypothetical protein